MKCPSCDFDNPPQMKFCGGCGAPLARTCPSCGTEAPPSFKFCGECGTALAAKEASRATSPPASAESSAPEPVPVPKPPTPLQSEAASRPKLEPESERKLVTVLSVDLAGASEMAEQWGPEVLHRLLDRFFEVVRGEIRRYGGTVQQVSGNTLLALFGAPVAHEDHARRALLAALEIRQALVEQRGRLGEPEGVELAARMGLDTGLVVVGGMEDLVVGSTPDRAHGIRQGASAGEVRASEATVRRVEALARVEDAPDSGAPEGLKTYRVLGLRAGAEDTAFDEAHLSPFVGRERELSALRELLEQAEGGRGQVVGLSGDAGSGKSRLLHELRRTLEGRRVVRLAGQCLSWGSGIPYLPLLSMIRRTSGISEEDAPETVRHKMGAGLREVGLEPEPHLPYFLRLLGANGGGRELQGLGAQAVHERTFASLRRMILAASEQALVWLELEDLHWIDETSETFLESLVEAIGASRVFVVLTYRSGYRPEFLDKSYATQISMRPLSVTEGRRVAEAWLDRAGGSRDRAEQIVEKAEGNPFFLEELARSVSEWDDEEAEGAVPDTVQGLLMARIDRLPEEHKRLLRTASVLGREFSTELLEVLWEGSAPGSILTDLEHWELVYAKPSGDRPGYVFKHALTQDVAYQSLLTERRRELHGKAARALERLYEGRLEETYDRLIHHYPKAGDAAKTVHYLTLFAEKAARDYAHAEAARALWEAISHAEELPEDRKDRRVVELVVQLADSLLPLARLPETLELLEAHQARVEELGDPELTGQFHFWLAHTHSYLGHQEAAERHARQAIEASKEAGDEATQGKAWYVLGRNGFWAGKFEEGLEASLEAVVLLERSGEPWWQGQAHWVGGFHHFVLGQHDEAFASMERTRTIGRALDDYRLDPCWSVGYFHAAQGDWEKGIEECRRGLEISRDPLNTAAALGFLGYAYLQKGDAEEAVETLEDAVERMEATGMQQLLGWFSVYLGESYALADRAEEARATIERGLEICREAEFRYGEGLGLEALGRVLQESGEAAEGELRLEEAAEVLGGLCMFRQPKQKRPDD